jgi:hypothetical protein
MRSADLSCRPSFFKKHKATLSHSILTEQDTNSKAPRRRNGIPAILTHLSFFSLLSIYAIH